MSFNFSTLFSACHSNSKQSFLEILKYNLNLHLQDKKGNTVLYYSVEYGDLSEAISLIKADVNKFIINKKSLSIYDFVKNSYPNTSPFYSLIIENDDDYSVSKELN
jgi:hypothetical protein